MIKHSLIKGPVKQGSLLCLLSWRRKKVGRPPGRDPANGASINGNPLVSISDQKTNGCADPDRDPANETPNNGKPLVSISNQQSTCTPLRAPASMLKPVSSLLRPVDSMLIAVFLIYTPVHKENSYQQR